VLPLTKFANLVKRMHVNIGIVTVPAEHAQSVVDVMVAAGIKAIWNFAPAPLHIPEGVILENARLTQSLAVLTNNLTRVLKEEDKE
ncbi:MAG: redox-sensing transcriptional repressor Rex, partial [Candidatus Omnitrophica bacterium]|nr:redox-sensing transcriptional repressor Rex [Candidatus Omnitrophota bacterium]